MRIAAAALILIACGGKATPPPVKPVAKPVVAAPTASCADVATLLRGNKLSKDAGTSKENILKTSCEADHWAPELMKCVTSTPAPQPCLDKLTAEQKKTLDGRLDDWRDEFGEEAVADSPEFDAHDFDDPPPDDDGDGDDGDDDYDDYVGCYDVDTDKFAKEYPAVPKETGADGDFIVKLRKDRYQAACTSEEYSGDGWTKEAKICLRDGGVTLDCVKKLTADQQTALAKVSTEIDGVVKKTFDLRKKPGSIGCPQVVAATYGDAKWKGKLDKVPAADRKKAIEASKTTMTKACTADKWDATQRACLVANDTKLCLGERNAWGFPARGVIIPTGIAECDAYIAALVKYATCKSTPKETQDAIMDSVSMVQETLRDASGDMKDTYKASCTQAQEAVKQMPACTP